MAGAFFFAAAFFAAGTFFAADAFFTAGAALVVAVFVAALLAGAFGGGCCWSGSTAGAAAGTSWAAGSTGAAVRLEARLRGAAGASLDVAVAARRPRFGGVTASASSTSSGVGTTSAFGAICGTARSMLRRAGAKLVTTNVTASPTRITSRALRGAGSLIIRSGTYPRASPIET